jgi:ribosomal protein S18 acetylase RimI-like enzyme
MKIIKSTESYLEQLVELFEEYRLFCGAEQTPKETRAFLQNLMRNDQSVIFIAIDPETDNVMGFVNLYPSYSTLALQRLWILNDLGVSRHFRGKGVSKALIKKVQEFAKETQAVRIELKTEIKNTRARSLYKAMNFIIDSENVYYRVPC